SRWWRRPRRLKACTCATATTCWSPTTPADSPKRWCASTATRPCGWNSASTATRTSRATSPPTPPATPCARCSSPEPGLRAGSRGGAQAFGELRQPRHRGIRLARRLQCGPGAAQLARAQALVADRQPALRQPPPRRRDRAAVVTKRGAHVEAGVRPAQAVGAQLAFEAVAGRREQARTGLADLRIVRGDRPGGAQLVVGAFAGRVEQVAAGLGGGGLLQQPLHPLSAVRR